MLNQIERLPAKNHPYLWADYVELLCIFNTDREISRADIISHIEKRKDLGERNVEPEEEEENKESGESEAEKNDNLTCQVGDIFRHLMYRRSQFGDFYPFYFIATSSVIKRKKKLNLQHKLYLFLLFSSCLRYIRKEDHGTLTNDFEVICYKVLKKYLPEFAEVHMFGKNPRNRGRYSGKLWVKIQRLASDLRVKVVAKESQFAKNDTGDNGLDLVGWLPLGDNAVGDLTVFCQCTCHRDEWIKKQHSSSYEAWSEVMVFKVPPANIIFIPFCFRDSQGEWHRSIDIKKSLMLDRVRVLHMMRSSHKDFLQLKAHKLVADLASQIMN